jgi:dihydroorotate dehydrogenase (fumarate)
MESVTMDLTTKYLGLQLKNPLVPSSGPYSHTIESLKKIEDSGAGAVVMFSLFEEQIAHESAELNHYLLFGTESFAEALSYFPQAKDYVLGPEEYVELIRKAKQSLSIPVIGSLNGISPGGWVKYAKQVQEAGADAIELNVYYIPTDPKLTAADVEERYCEVLRSVKQHVHIPIAMKLSPYFTSFAGVAQRFVGEGAKGVVLFNRFHQPDINLEKLEVEPATLLSEPGDIRLALRWTAILHGRLQASIAATGGVHTAHDVVKLLMAGADVTMMCSALIKNGVQHVTKVLADLDQWMLEHEYVSVAQMKGSMSQKSIADPAAFERAHYMKAISRLM